MINPDAKQDQSSHEKGIPLFLMAVPLWNPRYQRIFLAEPEPYFIPMKAYSMLLSAFLTFSSAQIINAQEIKWSSVPRVGFVFQISNNEAQKLLSKSENDTIINS